MISWFNIKFSLREIWHVLSKRFYSKQIFLHRFLLYDYIFVLRYAIWKLIKRHQQRFERFTIEKFIKLLQMRWRKFEIKYHNDIRKYMKILLFFEKRSLNQNDVMKWKSIDEKYSIQKLIFICIFNIHCSKHS